MRRPLLALLAGLVVGLCAAPAAHADAGGDDVWDAVGPISGGVAYSGTVSATDSLANGAMDADYYVFYTEGVHQMHLPQAASGDCRAYEFEDTDGKVWGADYTAPGPLTRVLIKVAPRQAPCSQSYSFTLDPSWVVAGPAQAPVASPNVEPNEDAGHAYGPLTAETWWTGALETVNDQDWMVFFTTPGTHQLDLQVSGDPGCPTNLATLQDEGGDVLAQDELQNGIVDHLRPTVVGAQRLFLHIQAAGAESGTGAGIPCVGTRWAFKLAPADAITQTTPPAYVPPGSAAAAAAAAEPPPDQAAGDVAAPAGSSATHPATAVAKKPSKRCLSARATRRTWLSRVKATERLLAQARRTATKRRLRRTLTAHRTGLHHADDLIISRCT